MSAISGGTKESSSIQSFFSPVFRKDGLVVSHPGKLSMESFLSKNPASLSFFD
jgi:hypothetical protein